MMINLSVKQFTNELINFELVKLFLSIIRKNNGVFFLWNLDKLVKIYRQMIGKKLFDK